MSRRAEAADRSAPWPGRILLVFRLILAALGVGWIALAGSIIFQPSLRLVAERLARGETYDTDGLRQMASPLPAGETSLCDVKRRRSALMIQLRVATSSIEKADLSHLDQDVGAVANLGKELLTCSPSDGFAWLGLYWAEIRQGGVGPKAWSYLAQSYRFAPHEAWIQLIRAPMVLRVGQTIPEPLRPAAVTDFDDIFRARLYPSAALIYKSSSAQMRIALLDRTCEHPTEPRAVFLHYVKEQGLSIDHRCYPAQLNSNAQSNEQSKASADFRQE
ncbi:hypothetical protein [Bradyrhizobium sp. URHA0013]|uniref:hypothetical protein n=1 Tax=Bradyrhizobium sp. URHA0013 TaxID=1380352 RepID=UPI0004BABE85|nr:hypothetical protein [Bradyrhizobium sp. URHA0013]